MLPKTKTAKTENPKKPRARRCKECGEWYNTQDDSKTCSRACQTAYAKRLRDEARAKKLAKLEKEKTKKAVKREKKANSHKVLEKKLDDVFSKYVRARDARLYGKCATCEENDSTKGQCGHFMSRRSMATRWHERNCSLQCIKCNMFNQGEQYKHGLELDRRWGAGTADEMMRLANTVFKPTTEWMKEMIAEYSERLDRENDMKNQGK